jgi:hypothetical protein
MRCELWMWEGGSKPELAIRKMSEAVKTLRNEDEEGDSCP